MLAKTEFEMMEEDIEDLKGFAAGLDEEDKHKSYAVGKDGSIEEMGMDKIIEAEDIGEWEEKMVGS